MKTNEALSVIHFHKQPSNMRIRAVNKGLYIYTLPPHTPPHTHTISPMAFNSWLCFTTLRILPRINKKEKKQTNTAKGLRSPVPINSAADMSWARREKKEGAYWEFPEGIFQVYFTIRVSLASNVQTDTKMRRNCPVNPGLISRRPGVACCWSPVTIISFHSSVCHRQ